ncbi:MAG: bifunctional oligoribonuclease/PAP phosphatase NrnA [Ignavibacteria bacterium]|nr:bifunctional oligoribonuclease/PAP phosphatase NrnA [Ignavibacteria bacterium]
MIDHKKLEKILTENKSFLLSTHVNPDADAIGSEIAMYFILKQLGKEVRIINHSAMPYNLRFLDPENKIEKYDKNIHDVLFDKSDVIVALDFNKGDRLVSMQEVFEKSTTLKICIDHHQDAGNAFNHHFNGTDYSATGHIIYDFIKQTNIAELNSEIANPLYAAIMTDTGSFRFERTNSDLHRIIADLLEYDVDPVKIYGNIYDENKLNKIKIFGRALSSMRLIGNGRISYMLITQKDFEEVDAIESDTDNIVEYSLTVENVILGMLFIEHKEGFKVSLRSKGNIPVNKLAKEFNGGGHTNAAGVRMHDSRLQDMLPKILERAEFYINNHLRE